MRVLALALTLAATVLIAAPANAEAFKTADNCGTSPVFTRTVRLTAFAGHHVDVTQRLCTNGTWLKFAGSPNISFPSRPNPAAVTESISVGQQPFIYSTGNCSFPSDKTCRVTWRFTAKQTVFKLPSPSEHVFYFRSYPAYNELCLGDTCARVN